MKYNLNFSQPKYSNSNQLKENFKKTYLTSLQLILDDDKFKEKAETLPLLKSSLINKYEKMLARKKFKIQSQNKSKMNIESNNAGQNKNEINNNEKPKKNNLEINPKKIIQTRYIILDKQLTEITLKSIEENSEINNKLTDPFNSFFQESNPKIRKNALDQIMNKIFVVENESKENEKDILPEINNNKKTNLVLDLDNYNSDKKDDIFYKDLETFENKFRLNTEIEQENHEKYGNAINDFEAKCLNYNIVTLGQKIDFFTYLYNEEQKKKHMLLKKATKKKTYRITSKLSSNLVSPKKSDKKINYYINNNLPPYIKKNLPILRRKSKLSNLIEGRLIYFQELKYVFKITEDYINSHPKIFEKFERELNYKIKNFQLVQTKLESSTKLIDKLKLYLLFCEISSEKIILRECNINSDSFIFLLSKQYLNFKSLKHVNVSKNNFGDIGGTYFLHLISEFSKDLKFLNISYTSIGKNSCDILINSLTDDHLKITTLNISGNNLGDELFSEILVAISSNNFVNKLYISDNNLGRIGSNVIGNFLKYDKKIKLLDVSKNNFDDEIITFMLKGLIINSSLDILFLNDLGLTNRSFRTFDTTLSINTNLKKLFLEKNKFNYKGIQKLSDILNSNKYLEYISLAGNDFEYEHINYANEQQRHIKLKVISKSEFFNQIGITENKNIIYDYLQ